MPRKTIREVLMDRDGLTAHEADEEFNAALDDFHQRLDGGEMPHNICEEWFGLEPDYIEEFM